VTEDFDVIYRDNVQRVARWAGWLCRSSGDVEDVVQEVFLTAYRLLPEFRGDAQVATWLYRLTANAARHHHRKRVRRQWLQLGVRALTADEPPAPSPQESLESSRELRLVREALDGLPEKYRTVLILSRLEGLSGEQIAELTETKLATVWVRLHRARAELAERFGKLRHRTIAPPIATRAKQVGGPS
jgi:RNA polymerase sigma-70 factor (ECF subfamily)